MKRFVGSGVRRRGGLGGWGVGVAIVLLLGAEVSASGADGVLRVPFEDMGQSVVIVSNKVEPIRFLGAPRFSEDVPLPGDDGALSMELDGINDCLDIDYSEFGEVSSFTLTLWVKSAGQLDDFARVASFGNGDLDIAVAMDDQIRFYSAGKRWMETGTALQRGEWSHLALRYDGYSLTGFLDGIKIFSFPWEKSDSTSFSIGASHGNTKWNHFAGHVYDVAFYPRALDDESIQLMAVSPVAGHRETDEGVTESASDGSGDEYEPQPTDGTAKFEGGNAPATPQKGLADLLKSTFLYVDLIGYWPMEEGEGDRTKDGSGGGHSGTLVGGAAWADDSPPAVRDDRHSVLLDGADDCITVEGNMLLSSMPNDFSFAAWIRPERSQGLQNIVFKEGQYLFALEPSGDGYPVLVVGYYGKSGEFVHLRSRESLRLDGWHHVVGQKKNTAFELYLDGRLVESGVTKGEPCDMAAGESDLLIGSGFAGGIDEVRIYNRALSASEALRLASLAGHWRLDEGGGTLAVDESGRNNHGEVLGLSSERGDEWSGWSRRVPSILFGDLYSFSFDGKDDLIEIPSNPTLDLEEFTVSFWVRAPTQEYERTVFIAHEDSGFESGLTGEQRLCFSIDGARWIETERELEANQWTHLAFIKEGGRLRFIVDGVEVSAINTSVALRGAIRLGASWDDEFGKPYKGGLDDVQIYNRALSPEELALVARPFDFGTGHECRTSPGWVEGSVIPEAGEIVVSVDRGERFNATRESSTRWYADNAGGQGLAMGVDLFPDRPTHLSISSTDWDGNRSRISKSYYWMATNLVGSDYERDRVTIRRDDSLLFVGLGLGDVLLDIDADGDGEYEVSGAASEKFPALYPAAGTFVARARVGEDEVGSLTVAVVDVDLSEPIACGLYFQRKKDVSIFPESARDEVAFSRNDPAILNVEYGRDLPQGVEILVQAHQVVNTGLVQARLGSETGPIIAQRNLDAFRLIAPLSAGVSEPYPDMTRVKNHVYTMVPPVPGLRIRVVCLGAMGTWLDSTRILDINTDDLMETEGKFTFDMLLHQGNGGMFTLRVYQGDKIVRGE